MTVNALLENFVSEAKNAFKQNLTGVYLHGSLAAGGFHFARSDVDILVVVENTPSDLEKRRFMDAVLLLNQHAPAKGIEMSVVERRHCSPVLYPTPFQLHFSPAHIHWYQTEPENYIANMKGEDKDLGAHFAIVKKYGKALLGPNVDAVFGQISPEAYLDSILYDVKESAQSLPSAPASTILNLCRTLAFVQDGLCLSKTEGGSWALGNTAERYWPLIQSALNEYLTGEAMLLPPYMDVATAFVNEILSKLPA